jgi:uncharacterized protein
MRFVDTNIFVRFLTRDDPVKAAACFALFQRVQAGEEEVTTCEAVVTEVVYVLSSRTLYNLSAEEIRSLLVPLLTLPGFKLPQKQLFLRALDLYALHPSLDIEDLLIVAHMEHAGIEELLSYDRDFDRVPTISRQEP